MLAVKSFIRENFLRKSSIWHLEDFVSFKAERFMFLCDKSSSRFPFTAHISLSTDIFPWLPYIFCRPTHSKVNWNHNSTISGIHWLFRKVMCVSGTHSKTQLYFIMVIETEIISRETKGEKQAHWEGEILLPCRHWRQKEGEISRLWDFTILQALSWDR